MKGILIIVVILASIGSQAQSVSREAVNSAGATMDNGSYSLSMSLGQIAITTLEQPGNSLTQGFQQPESHCFGDINGDGFIDTADLLLLLGDFGCLMNCSSDLTGDGFVNTDDLLAFLGVYGTSCS